MLTLKYSLYFNKERKREKKKKRAFHAKVGQMIQTEVQGCG